MEIIIPSKNNNNTQSTEESPTEPDKLITKSKDDNRPSYRSPKLDMPKILFDYPPTTSDMNTEEIIPVPIPRKTPELGTNHPQCYEPTICIDSPPQDPENKPKRRKSSTKEYDPECPSMTKSYNCDKCHKTFRSKGSLARHNQTNHTKESYECEECGLRILRKDSIKRHYQHHHPECSLPKHLIVNSEKAGSTSRLVKFHVRSKSPLPKSQFAKETEEQPIQDREDILSKIMETLQSYK
jgi:DNA-directed RNA polymerase subunit RPC12/RpoP